MTSKSKILVADTGAFINNVPLWDYGEEIYSVPDVFEECRTRHKKSYVVNYPVKIQFKEPKLKNVYFVRKFSQLIGYNRCLSKTDLKVMALAYELEVNEKGNSSHLRKKPSFGEVLHADTYEPAADDLEGFYRPVRKEISKKSKENEVKDSKNDNNEKYVHSDISRKLSRLGLSKAEKNKTIEEENEEIDEECIEDDGDEDWEDVDEENNSDNSEWEDEEDDEAGEYDEEEENYSDEQLTDSDYDDSENFDLSDLSDLSDVEEVLTKKDKGKGKQNWRQRPQKKKLWKEGDYDSESDGETAWITPQNLFKLTSGINDEKTYKEPAEANVVACMTNDFAMQNTMRQIGLTVLGVNGLMIRTLHNFIERCYSCLAITTRMGRMICFSCGNQTLVRVPITVKRDGTMIVGRMPRIKPQSRKKQIPEKEKRGGRHNPKFIQPIFNNGRPNRGVRPSKKALSKIDAMSEDYVARATPFATRDTNSRAALLGINVSRKYAS